MNLFREAVPSFDNFIATPAAGEALHLARNLAEGRADAPRLLLLHGPPGSGKSHLLRAIVHAAGGGKPPLPVLLTTATEYVQELITAARGHAGRPLPREGVVALDDLHVLSGKAATEREVARGLAAALDQGCRLACAVGRLDETPNLVEAVRGMHGARLAALGRPGPGDLRRILDVMAAAEGWSLPPETLDSMAAACDGDVRRAAGAIALRRFEAAGAARR